MSTTMSSNIQQAIALMHPSSVVSREVVLDRGQSILKLYVVIEGSSRRPSCRTDHSTLFESVASFDNVEGITEDEGVRRAAVAKEANRGVTYLSDGSLVEEKKQRREKWKPKPKKGARKKGKEHT